MITNWKTLIEEEMKKRDETWDDVVARTLTDEQLHRKFDNGFGGAEGVPFTLWTNQHVYFPKEYDGADGVRSVPRHPCGEATEHV